MYARQCAVSPSSWIVPRSVCAARSSPSGPACEACLRIRLEPDGPRFLADTDAGLDGAIGVLYAIVAWAMADDSWRRLKACPGRRCGWVFYDQSRNQSARWCVMQICGAQEKARAYYRRKTGA